MDRKSTIRTSVTALQAPKKYTRIAQIYTHVARAGTFGLGTKNQATAPLYDQLRGLGLEWVGSVLQHDLKEQLRADLVTSRMLASGLKHESAPDEKISAEERTT